MNDTNAKQQIVDRIKKSNNILVTVSNDPSVDELSAALGLTVLLNKMNKHATAVFSGAIPPAITFLEPDKTFENTVDSLRDFIIALDKEKADHLRYKVEGDVVKIFITPYRTTITSDDLDFSQGDYNVELVLALGVKNKDHLDGALMAHGRILHDATVATFSAGNETSDLGSIAWNEAGASSLSEMLVSLTDSLKGEKSLLDEQVATAFLTGLVAATDRFSNNRTSSKVMTIAAQLMAAGANQQLIALKLQEANTISGDAPTADLADATNSDGTTDLAEDTSTKLKRGETPAEAPVPDGELSISHQLSGNLDEVAKATAALQQQAAADAAEAELEKRSGGKRRRNRGGAVSPEDELANGLAQTTATTPSVADMQEDLAKASEELSEAAQPVDGEPSLGGTLNATTEQAADEKRRALEHDQNHTILSHDRGEYIGDQAPTFQAPINAANDADEEQSVPDIFSQSPNETTAPTIHAAPVTPLPPTPAPAPEPVVVPEPPVVSGPTLADLDAQHRSVMPEPLQEDHADARAAVEAAFGAVPYEPAPIPLPSNQPAPAPVEPPAATPAMPPLPDFSTLPPLPPSAPQPPVFGAGPAPEPPQPQLPPQPPADPGQFRIPGQ